MHEKPVINTKSIPSFTILLPVISLVSVTLFVLIMINGIKNDLLESDAKESTLRQEAALKKELKSIIDQAVSQAKSLLQIESIEYTRQLKNQIIRFSKDSTATLSDKNLRSFNKEYPLFQAENISKEDIKNYLTPERYKEYQKTNSVAVTQDFSFINNKSTLQYFKKLHNQHYLISFKRETFLNKHAEDIAQNLQKINTFHSSSFSIHKLNPKQELIPFIHHGSDKPNPVLNERKFIKQVLLENNNGAFKTMTIDNKEVIVYAQACPILRWVISIETQTDSMKAANKRHQETRSIYFEKKTQELLIVIVIVATIVLLLSLIVAKIINTIFTRFKKQIEDQNSTLKSFNRELTHKVSEQTTELKESEARYRTIFERSRDGVIILNDERISYCNESTLKMFGIHLKASLIGMPIIKLFPKLQPDGNESSKLLRDYLDITAALGHSRFEVLLEKANKQTFYVDVWLQNIELEGQRTVHVVFRDIDFQKNAQEKIKEQHKELLVLNETLEEKVRFEVLKNQEKEQLLVHQSRLAQMGEMISMIAHQWRQPLSAISTSSANMKLLIELDQYTKETFTRNLDQIDEYIQHLSETINDFRNFFKPDKQTEKTTLGEVIGKSLNIIFQSLQGHEISVSQSIDDDVEILTYPHELMQVVLNILKNAEDILLERKIKNRHIHIAYERLQHAHKLTFSDNAGGIPEEIMDNIFDPYFSTKHQKNGTGLGLYMSRVIITEHCRGTLSAHNNDEGAVFDIELPID